MLKALRALLGKTPREEPAKNPAQNSTQKPAQKPAPRSTTKPAAAATDYRAVSVTPGAKCCEAAKSIAGKRHLLREGLRLPLANCSKPADCTCKFKKASDRRDDDRRIGVTETGRWFAGQEKRKRGGRRRSGKE